MSVIKQRQGRAIVIKKRQKADVVIKVKVPKRFDALTKQAADKGSYTTQAEFVRSSVRRLSHTLNDGSNFIPVNNEEVEWTIRLSPRLNEEAEAAVSTGSFQSKAEFVRYAVRLKIKLLLPRVRL